MDENEYKRLQKVIIKVVHTQIADENPPETKKTMARLLTQGYSEEKAMGLIGIVVAAEVLGVYKDGRTYDEERYVRALKALPEFSE